MSPDFEVSPSAVDLIGQDARRHQVAILLSTFNGSRFLGSMLQSLTSQTMNSWVMYWRDDGSQDDTTDIIRNYAIDSLGLKGVEGADGKHLGTLASYMRLLAAGRLSGARHFAFADQDDVWLPGKLARAIGHLDSVPSHIPALYCGRQRLVDVNLMPIGLSPAWTPAQDIASALTQNIATGCTVLFNRAACDLILKTRPPPDSLHDWWSYLAVAAARGRIFYDTVPMILYRQHKNNQVGSHSGLISRAHSALRRGRKSVLDGLRSHVTALLADQDLLCESARADLEVIKAGLAGRLSERIQAIRLPGFRRQSALETALFRAWFLLG